MKRYRMFALSVLDSDAFLQLPLEAQLLYLHLCMRADDDGFVGNLRSIAKITGCRADALQVLIQTGFLLRFSSGIGVVVHWKVHNPLHDDHYHETVYLKEKSCLRMREDHTYALASCRGYKQNRKAVPILNKKERKENHLCQRIFARPAWSARFI